MVSARGEEHVTQHLLAASFVGNAECEAESGKKARLVDAKFHGLVCGLAGREGTAVVPQTLRWTNVWRTLAQRN